MFREMVDAGDRACALEVSSHALAQERAAGIDFDAVVFTNLTRDHLDYHSDLDDYFAAKRRLFLPGRRRATAPPSRWSTSATSTAGASSPTAAPAYGDDLWTFAVAGRPATPDRRPTPSPRDLELRADALGLHARGAAPGRRASASRCAWRRASTWRTRSRPRPRGLALGLPAAAVARGPRGHRGRARAASRPCAPGSRSAWSSTTRTRPDSLENALRAARAVTTRPGARRVRLRRRPRPRQAAAHGRDRRAPRRPRLRHLGQPAQRGAAGDHRRDRRRRAPRARAAPSTVEPDRRAAIRLALDEARAGDTVVIAGKGHEQGQIVGRHAHPLRRPRRRRGALAELRGSW